MNLPRGPVTTEALDPGHVRALVSSHALLRTLSPGALLRVIQGSRVVHLRPRRIFLRTKDPSTYAYLVLSGAVRVFHRNADGAEILVKLFRAPALLCEMEVLSGIPVMPWAQTLEYSTLLFMPAQLFQDLAVTEEAFSHALLKELATRLCVTSDQQRALAFSDVDRRLANLLLDYAHLAGAPAEGGVRIELRLSQDQLAQDLGISRRAVATALKKLEGEGTISRSSGCRVIHDLPRLLSRSSRRLALAHRVGAKVADLGFTKQG